MARQEQVPFVPPGGARAQGRVTADPSRAVPLIDTLHLTYTQLWREGNMDNITIIAPAEVRMPALKNTNWDPCSHTGLILEKGGRDLCFLWINNRRKPKLLHRQCTTEGNTLVTSSVQINDIIFLLRGMRPGLDFCARYSEKNVKREESY